MAIFIGYFRICHPYEYELQVFEPPERQLKEEKEKVQLRTNHMAILHF